MSDTAAIGGWILATIFGALLVLVLMGICMGCYNDFRDCMRRRRLGDSYDFRQIGSDAGLGNGNGVPPSDTRPLVLAVDMSTGSGSV